ncbi:P-loop containing nucleoside triphosphate hydrolase protein [Mycena latifolia]|nr:P-loop containing nucleoside triphosphate hydrolase protein [Mycena latifolia]
MAPSRGRKRWQTPEGHATIRKIVEEKIPEWQGGLHDWQVMVVAWILDGEDVLCITATGDGKSAIFAVPMIVLLEVARNPTAYPGFVSPKKPVGIVIAPTKGLSTNIVYELEGLRVPALACTSETLTEARKAGRNLTAEIAECRWAIICIDPEHLTDKQWERITNSQVFRENIVFACVDEGHLIDEWGLESRPAFRRIGPFLRGCLPPHISIFALSATIQPGAMTKSICRVLGLRPNVFHLLRRSNERTNIQFLIQPLTHGLGGTEFPDLLQYLADGRKTIIYCATIELCWRVFVYLFRLLPPGPRRLRRVRLYHAMCWPEENEKTVALIRDDPLCQIIVATVAFGQGFNVKSLLDSIQLGVPKTVAQALQQGGRVGRNPLTTGRTDIFAQASAYTAAEKYLKARNSGSQKPTKPSTSLTTMKKALMLTTKGCLIVFFNKLYGNSTRGALIDCIELPRRSPCSNCLPRFIGPLFYPPSPLPTGQRRLAAFAASSGPLSAPPKPPRKQQKLTRKMRVKAEAQLQKFRDLVYSLERENESHGYTPLSAYLSAPTIAALLDHFLQISSFDILSATIPRWKYHSHHGESLFKIICDLQRDFAAQFELARLERNEKNRLRAKAKRAGVSAAESEGEPESEDEDEDEEMAAPKSPAAAKQPALERPPKRRVPLEDMTNAPRAKRQTLQSVAEVIGSFRPQYRPRRRGNLENDTT